MLTKFDDINNYVVVETMPLSRHFYSLDEVHAALTYSSRRNDSLQTLFWCQELILSGHIGETISTLFEAWLWHKGPFHLSWLQHAWSTLHSDTLLPHDILLAASHLSTIPYQQQDHSLWNILSLSSQQEDPLSKGPSVQRTELAAPLGQGQSLLPPWGRDRVCCPVGAWTVSPPKHPPGFHQTSMPKNSTSFVPYIKEKQEAPGGWLNNGRRNVCGRF